jgi:hypothetical protein
MEQVLTEANIELLVKAVGALVLVVLMMLFRRVVAYAEKSWDLKVSDQQRADGERAISDAVAAIEAHTKKLIAAGVHPQGHAKQQMALERAREISANGLAHMSDDGVRTRIDAEVERVNRASQRPPPAR